MTATWHVDLAIDLDQPITMDMSDQIGDELDVEFSASVAHQKDGRGISVGGAVDAPNWREALDHFEKAVEKQVNNIGLSGSITAVEVLPWEQFEAQLGIPNYPDLVSVSEAAPILGVSRQRVHQLLAEDKLPAPLYRLGSGPLWVRSAMQAFAKRRNRKGGRRRKEAADA